MKEYTVYDNNDWATKRELHKEKQEQDSHVDRRVCLKKNKVRITLQEFENNVLRNYEEEKMKD